MQTTAAASGTQRRRSLRIAEKQMANETNGFGVVGVSVANSRPLYKRRSLIPPGGDTTGAWKETSDPNWLLASKWVPGAAVRVGVVQESPTPRSCRDVSASATRSSGYFSLVGSASCSSSLQAANAPRASQPAEREVRTSVPSLAADVVDGCFAPSGLLTLPGDSNNNLRPRPTPERLLEAPLLTNSPKEPEDIDLPPLALRALAQLAAHSNASPVGDLLTTWRALRSLDASHGVARRSLLAASEDTAACAGLLVAQRGTMLAMLNEAAARDRVLRETFYLAADYLDRYLAALKPPERVRIATAPQQIKLLAAACLFVAAKLEEIYPPKVEHLANGLQLNACDVLNGEILVCTRLGWCLEPTATPFRWLLLFANTCATFSRVQVACANVQSSRTAASQARSGRSRCNELLLTSQLDKGTLMEMCAVLDAAMLDGSSLRFTGAQLAAGLLSFYCGDLLTVCTGFTRAQLAPCIAFLLPFMYAALFAKNGRLSLSSACSRRMSLPVARHSSLTVADLQNEWDLQSVALNGETQLEKSGVLRLPTVEVGPKCASATGSGSVIPLRVLNLRSEVRAASLFAPDEVHLMHVCVAPDSLLAEARQIRVLLAEAANLRRCQPDDADAAGRRRSRKRNSVEQSSEAACCVKRPRTQNTTNNVCKRRRSCKPKLA